MDEPELIPIEDISLELEKLANTILSISDSKEWLENDITDEDIMNATLVFMNICNRRQWKRIYSDGKIDVNSPIVEALVDWTASTLHNYILQTTGVNTKTYYQDSKWNQQNTK